MPNHVLNLLSFQGDPEAIEKMKQEIQNEEEGPGSIDFNKLIPMPPELAIESGSRTHDGIKLYNDFLEIYRLGKGEEVDLLTIPEESEKAFLRQRKDIPEATWNLGRAACRNIQQFGCPTWYEWCNRHWDTKWNAYDFASSQDVLCFNTAWAAPHPVIQKLSERYTEYRCSCGDDYKDNYTDALGHSFTEQSIAATCTSGGYTLRTCSRCGATETTDTTPVLGHDYRDTVVAPTTTSEGYTEHTCSRCGDSYRDSYTDKIKEVFDLQAVIEYGCFYAQNLGFTMRQSRKPPRRKQRSMSESLLRRKKLRLKPKHHHPLNQRPLEKRTPKHPRQSAMETRRERLWSWSLYRSRMIFWSLPTTCKSRSFCTARPHLAYPLRIPATRARQPIQQDCPASGITT